MNVPNLTRENVASHLQKYRKFLRDVNEKGMIGGISQRALRSRFASSLPMSLIKTMQEKRANKFHTPTFENLQTLSYQTENQNNYFNLFNRFPSRQINNFPYVQKAPNLQYLNQFSLEKSNLEPNIGSNNSIYDQNPIGINSSNSSFFPVKNLLYDGGSSSSSFSSSGGGQGWTTSSTTSSSSFLTRDLNFNDMSLDNKSFKGGNEISPQAEITSCRMKELPISSNESSKKLQGNNGFSNEGSSDRFTRDKESKKSTSTNDLEFDMDIVEALFGTIDD
ncbi:putative two-component response regulator ARR13 [Vicia villosa]|uniref:putative two-component response regulator ARR13 n=1 Tax=Vicia villosa TaxID=3911 RepID=UPI00273C42E7|nr:putative two-component response regulator ARR13 [Vicia villosa]